MRDLKNAWGAPSLAVFETWVIVGMERTQVWKAPDLGHPHVTFLENENYRGPASIYCLLILICLGKCLGSKTKSTRPSR
jgi:hypothetical protein